MRQDYNKAKVRGRIQRLQGSLESVTLYSGIGWNKGGMVEFATVTSAKLTTITMATVGHSVTMST